MWINAPIAGKTKNPNAQSSSKTNAITRNMIGLS